ncbi:type I restriction endonuclease subunit R [uncultured Polaribacter sp.]|uniref:type I restriction endonuclease subunit R n=1 Tax=uncultured Polaribacter sp. TaxID=174711 RepID=UPI00262C8C73|nr:type I restriction endonuclease subunit R [uncultured Polaribacter sp.]
MTIQSEQLLENSLVSQLVQLGYGKVVIKDEDDLLLNLKSQLEKHNKITLSDNDFKQILNYINKGSIFQRAKILRDRVPFTNNNGESKTIELINQLHWCKNEFQVTQQVTMEGTYKNRYDLTILINGLPLVQIELKRRGLELKEAFNQINRYERHSFGAGAGLFQFVQIFVISNGVNTKYYANSPIKARSFKQTFYWSDTNNKLVTQLSKFTDIFLEPCHISKMIARYVVLNESAKILMVLRPYQYFAVEAIIERVKNTTKNGFIWHTTGSGKTLTSFKASQILTHMPKVHKVVFVVDRKDLDYQTTKVFNSFSKGSIDGTNNTKALVKQLAGDNKLIVTTIQKLNTAISKTRYLNQMEVLKDKRVIFIFDECHRSQFGKTHQDIKNFFQKSQMFGFTGTPIFEDNAGTNEFGKRTTAMLFGGEKSLHKYVITDAIRDENVLKFSIEYINTFKKKEHMLDIDVEAIDEKEVMEAPERLDAITEYIIANHNRKTHSKEFTAIMCVSNVETLIKYYQLFKAKEHNLKVATIFSYQANEEDKDALGFTTSEFDEVDLNVVAEPVTKYKSQHTREHLDSFIADYNKTFGTNYSTKDTQSYYNYYNDIAKRVKHKQVDILLVVIMFLTGFDSKTLNTIYVDKNLKYHGLIQAFSRTNRILNEVKSQGNVVCFRNLKQHTDDAIALFSNIESKDEIIIAPYEDYVKKMDEAFIQLLQITPTIDSVSHLESEEDELDFAKAFRELMRTLNVLKTFTEFTFDDISINEQSFEDYKSKYLDLRDKVKRENAKEKVSILNDIDFELELIHRDEINVSYILKLLANLKNSVSVEDKEKQLKNILDIVAGDTQLRSKRELIEKFINEHIPTIEDSEDIPDEFIQFMTAEKLQAIKLLSSEEGLNEQKLEKVIGDYMFTEKIPLRDDIIGTMNTRPSLKERKTKAERITNKILEFVETFISGITS